MVSHHRTRNNTRANPSTETTTAHPTWSSKGNPRIAHTRRVHVTATHSLPLKHHTGHWNSAYNTVGTAASRTQQRAAFHTDHRHKTLATGPQRQSSAANLKTCSNCLLSYTVVSATATAKLANTATRHHSAEMEEWPAHKHPSLQHTSAVIVAADITHASLQHQHNDNTPYSHVHNARHQHERGLATQQPRHHTATRERA